VSAAPRASRATPAQAAAGRRNLIKARAALKARHVRTPAQIAASRRNLAIARAAQRARASGKPAVSAKKVKAPGGPGLHELPLCGPAAVAEHLAVYTGIVVPDESVLALHRIVQPARLGDLLEYLQAEGFPGTGEKLAHFERCDPDCGAPGLVYGIQLRYGYHAVLAMPEGTMASWGKLMPRAGTPEEAWWLEWEAE
jgi:hypothetical protein